jgi:hypothetical protein
MVHKKVFKLQYPDLPSLFSLTLLHNVRGSSSPPRTSHGGAPGRRIPAPEPAAALSPLNRRSAAARASRSSCSPSTHLTPLPLCSSLRPTRGWTRRPARRRPERRPTPRKLRFSSTPTSIPTLHCCCLWCMLLPMLQLQMNLQQPLLLLLCARQLSNLLNLLLQLQAR